MKIQWKQRALSTAGLENGPTGLSEAQKLTKH